MLQSGKKVEIDKIDSNEVTEIIEKKEIILLEAANQSISKCKEQMKRGLFPVGETSVVQDKTR